MLHSKSQNNPHAVYCVLKLENSHFNTCAMAETREFEIDSFVCGYHVCWTPVIGEQLVWEREEGNPRAQYVVAIKKMVT